MARKAALDELPRTRASSRDTAATAGSEWWSNTNPKPYITLHPLNQKTNPETLNSVRPPKGCPFSGELKSILVLKYSEVVV